MKTTVDLPDELVIELKVIAAREQRKLRAVMAEMLDLGLRARSRPSSADESAQAAAEDWLTQWRDLGRRIEAMSIDSRSGVEILLADRR